jgi:DNA-binding IclR family transcriptional regulator
MSEKIPVEAVVVEKTFVGKVKFQRTVKFLLAALNGKRGLKPKIDLQDIAIKTAMQYSEMDTIIRDLIEKNYARLGDHLDLYRFWVVLLHVKGVRFEPARD